MPSQSSADPGELNADPGVSATLPGPELCPGLATEHTLTPCPFLQTILQTQEASAAEPKPWGDPFALLSIRLRGKQERRGCLSSCGNRPVTW